MAGLFRTILLALLLSHIVSHPVRAEADQVRIVMPFGLAFLPAYVAIDRGLIEAHARAAGLGEVKVVVSHMTSGPASSDLLLAGDADIAMGGFGPAFLLWDKTRGAQKVRGMMALSSSPVWLLSTDPHIHSIRDFGPGDRIAVSAIKVTPQAIALQLAAAKEWGWDQRFHFDPMLVAMANADALAMLLSGSSEVKTHAAIIPFSVEEMESGKVHRVMNSDDYLEPDSSITLMYAIARFHDRNPKLYAATAAAFEEAFDFIRAHPHESAQIYVAREPQKRDLAWIEAMIVDPRLMRYSATPRGMMKYATFMQAAGLLKNKPERWQDLFWENMASKDGS